MGVLCAACVSDDRWRGVSLCASGAHLVVCGDGACSMSWHTYAAPARHRRPVGVRCAARVPPATGDAP
jgi:hypothetical protein